MALYFKEFLNSKIKVTDNANDSGSGIDFSESYGLNSAIGTNGMVVAEIEGVHDIRNGNFVLYTKEAMESSIKSWTYPYEKALIMNHDEKDGEVIGRVKSAYIKDSEVIKGATALAFNVAIMNKKSQEATLDGRNKTVSIGITAHSVTCSVCGQELAGGDFCGHDRGKVYDGILTYWIVHDMTAKELSFVNVPSNQYAIVTNAYRLESNEGVDKSMNMKENLDNSLEGGSAPNTEMKESTNMNSQGIPNSEETKKVVADSEKEIIKTLHKDKRDLEVKLEKAKAENEDINLLIKKLKEKTSKLEKILLDKEEAIMKEIALRESLEEELSESRKVVKEDLIKQISNMRENHLGLETNVELFSGRTIESLKDTVLDLKEQIDNKVEDKIGTVLKEGLVDENQNEVLSKQSKESNKKEETIKPKLNLKEALADIVNK